MRWHEKLALWDAHPQRIQNAPDGTRTIFRYNTRAARHNPNAVARSPSNTETGHGEAASLQGPPRASQHEVTGRQTGEPPRHGAQRSLKPDTCRDQWPHLEQ